MNFKISLEQRKMDHLKKSNKLKNIGIRYYYYNIRIDEPMPV